MRFQTNLSDPWKTRFAFIPMKVGISNGKNLWIWFEHYQTKIASKGAYEMVREYRIPNQPKDFIHREKELYVETGH